MAFVNSELTKADNLYIKELCFLQDSRFYVFFVEMNGNSAELSHHEKLKSARIEVCRGADDGSLFKYRFQ